MAKKKNDITPEKIEEAIAKGAKEVVERIEEAIEPIAKEMKKEFKEAKKEVVKASSKVLKAAGKKIAEAADMVAEASPENVLIVESDDKKTKLEKLKAKAKALEAKVSDKDKTTIKEKVTGEKEEKKDMLVPIEDYLKSSIHLGTRVITPDMRPYVYRRRADGLAVFNTSLLDDKIRAAIDYLSQFAPNEFIVVCKREAGWKAAKMFADTIGVRSFTKKYPSGILTNTQLGEFFETDMVFICDPWLDKNALHDANRVKLNVLSVCDTNNFTAGINCIIPSNNKSWKSLGMIFYLLTKGYIEKRKLDISVPPIQAFIEGWDTLQPPV